VECGSWNHEVAMSQSQLERHKHLAREFFAALNRADSKDS
jgi:hypothetical protein